ncbi:MAG: ATP-binding protein [Paludibacteraceae bacterium]|nr:ATP-binding protein [Paludibacteraceae bacterium]
MSESNELTFGLSEDNPIGDLSSEQTIGLETSPSTSGDEAQTIKGLSKEEYNDPNQIRVTIADPNAPLVILFGPPACGKTMTLVRLARFLNKRGYKISPIRTFRPNDDQNYIEICKPENFSKIINSPDAANSTANVSFMLVEVVKNGKRLCQILEAPGEYYFNPNDPNAPFPSYVNTIIACGNRKLWAIMVEPDWKNTEDRIAYVGKINELSRQMDVRDKTIFIFNKIDKTNFTRKKGQINIPQARVEISNLYPGIFAMFKNQNPITSLWKDYLCGFVPFQTGTYTITTKTDSNGNVISNYQEGPDNYPQMLWDEIQKSITG